MKQPIALICWALTVCIGAFGNAMPVWTDTNTELIAISGDGPPGGGQLDLFYPPVVNNQGQVAFTASINGGEAAAPWGVFRFDEEVLTSIVGAGSLGNSTLRSAYLPTMNKNGEVAFCASTVRSTSHVFRGAGGPLTEIVRLGQTAPGGGTIVQIPFQPQINNAGQVAVAVSFNPATGATGGIYRGSGGTLTEIARLQRPAPTGGEYNQFHFAYPINSAGQVAFGATTSLPNSGAIFIGDGSATVTIVQQGDTAPDGDGVFGNMGGTTPALNDSGEVAFVGQVYPFANPIPYEGVFLNRSGALKQIVRGGEPTPRGDANFYAFSKTPVLNNAGQTAFIAFLRPANPLHSLAAVYRGDEPRLTEIMREGMIAPDGNGNFVQFSPPEINANGQIAVLAELGGTYNGAEDNQGLYFYSDTLGLVQVARRGQPMLGSRIAFLDYKGGSLPGGGAMGINDFGQVTYSFGLTDGRRGIAIWQIPEPSCTCLLVFVAVFWPSWRRAM